MTRQKGALNAAILLVFAIALSACFKSETALILAEDAAFPFTRLTYADPKGREYTIARSGDVYVNPGEDDKTSIRLMQVGDDLYLGQIAADDDDEPVSP